MEISEQNFPADISYIYIYLCIVVVFLRIVLLPPGVNPIAVNKYIYIKVNWSRYRPDVAQRVGRAIAVLFHDRGTRRGWVVSSTPRRTLPPEKTLYPFYKRMGWSQGRSGRSENLVPTGIRSRTVQFVVSRYTDWATRPIYIYIYTYIKYIYFVKCQTSEDPTTTIDNGTTSGPRVITVHPQILR